jgi:hypothetical protein
MKLKYLATGWVLTMLAVVSVSAQDVMFHAGQFTVELGKMGLRVPVEARTVKDAPYSAEVVTEDTQTLADGNRIVQRSAVRVFRDSQGRTRREEDRPSGGPIVSITDPVAGTSFSLDTDNRRAVRMPSMIAVNVAGAVQKLWMPHEASKVVTTVPRGAAAAAVFAGRGGFAVTHLEASRGNEQIKIETLPARDFEGVRAEGVRRTTTIPAGEIGNDWPIEVVSEEWFSPELQVLVSTERRDPRLGTSTYRLQNIIRAEPAPYLFEVPSDYTVQATGRTEKLEAAQPR